MSNLCWGFGVRGEVADGGYWRLESGGLRFTVGMKGVEFGVEEVRVKV